MKTLLAIPTARYIETECIESLFGMKKKGKVEMLIPRSYSVDVARNIIAKYAQEHKFDYIMWVDSDMIIPKDTLVKLLSHDKKTLYPAFTLTRNLVANVGCEKIH